MKTALIAITKHGVCQVNLLAAKLDADIVIAEKFSHLITASNNCKAYSGAFRQQIGGLFGEYQQLVFFVSLGAVVRLLAPHLKSKDTDPGVIVIDEAGQFVIPLLSGHVGGANAFAEQLAGIMGAVAVLTTASDVGKTIAVDILGRELGWTVEAPKINITRVSACVVNEENIAFIQEAGSQNWWNRPTPLPENIHLFSRFEEVDFAKYAAVLWVTDQPIGAPIWQRFGEKLVVYRTRQ